MSVVQRVMLILSLLLFSACNEEAIVHELSEIQANRVLVTLDRAGIKSEKKKAGQHWAIYTAQEQAKLALVTLEESRVLRDDFAAGKGAGNASLVQSREERMQLVERQLAGSLEATLETLPEVLQARVHLFLDTSDKLSLLPNPPKQSASVLLISERPEAIDRAQVQRLIAGASGVAAEQVSVLLSTSRDSRQNHMSPPVGKSSDSLLSSAKPRTIAVGSVGESLSPPTRTVSALNPSTFAISAALSLLLIPSLIYLVSRKRKSAMRLKPPSLKSATSEQRIVDESMPDLSKSEFLGRSSLNGRGAELHEEVF